MRAAFDLMEANHHDLERFTDADIAFHHAVLASTGNPLLTRLIEMIGPALRLGRRIGLERRADATLDSQRGHRGVLEAIEAGEPETARLAMREHLSWTANLSLTQPATRRA
jgi:DNA-binding FadR family transcriptional regulator